MRLPVPAVCASFVIASSCSMAANASADWPLACQATPNPASSSTGVAVTFHALAGDGIPPYTFAWNFGDGGTSTEQNPSHAYSQSGTYRAVLTVTDATLPPAVCRDTALVFIGIAYDPACLAYSSTRWGKAPLSVSFGANPVFCGGYPSDSWSWRFGNGDTSNLQSPSEIYQTPGTYWAAVTLSSPPCGATDCFPVMRVTALSGVVGVGPSVLDGLRLDAAQPNPFRTMALLQYRIPRPGRVRLTISDAGGRLVAELVNDHRSSGPNVALWQGRDIQGRRAPPGIYFARLDYEGGSKTTTLVRLR